MTSLLGENLKEKSLITEDQLRQALERQRLCGGRLGENLVALGFITKENIESTFKRIPTSPASVEETGLGLSFIADLVLKHTATMGDFTLSELSNRVKLPISILDKVLEKLRVDHMLEVKGAGQISRLSYKFAVTDAGRRRVVDLRQISQYVGPAPVVFDQYRLMVEIQTVKNMVVTEETVQNAFAHLVLNKSALENIGPAVNSGRAIFLYGPTGNGKTTVAEAIGRMLPGSIYVPYSVIVNGEIITVYDKVTHRAVPPDAQNGELDQRWVKIQRPVIMAGGELTLKTLDLEFNPIAKFYEAPLQMKANNGLFLVDDFGRQLMDPQVLLNRWIVPLERRTDFLTFQTGMKFEIPFDQLVIFSTNLDPVEIVDEAFLRRIHYKVKLDHPSREEYEKIFKLVCEWNDISFNPAGFDFLMDLYKRSNVSLSACHPRDLIDHIIDKARYRGISPVLSEENIQTAWNTYFVEL